MAQPWRTVETVATADGDLQLRARGERDFMITIAGRVLMVSQVTRSEEELARLAAQQLGARTAPRVLIGGLGMGYTLRAALDVWPADARIVVCEINPVVVAWCRGPLACLTDRAVDDPRVAVEVGDVAATISQAAGAPPSARFDAILLDLYEGPNEACKGANRAYYGDKALATTRRALRANGAFAVWSEDPDAAFEKRLRAAGFNVERQRPKGGGRRHAVYLARPR